MQRFKKAIVPNKVAMAAALAVFQIGAAWAQTEAANPLNLDEVVITASPTGRTKMKSSDSVTSLGEEAIVRSGATNTAEILRAIPGIRSESSGGEGNANVVVRGIPLSAGGARYVQFQEDGLPVLLFGDIAFGTPDQFMRADYMTDRVEVVRGGSSSTLASNAPGAVVNFLSKTGKENGGSVGYTMGLGNRLNRVDYSMGQAIGTDTRFNIGGFVRQADGGPASTNYNAYDGSQIRGNLTKDLDNGGYVRLNFKQLNDKTPTLLPVPVSIRGGSISALSTIDPRLTSTALIGAGFNRDVVVDRNGGTVASNPQEGLQVNSNSIGLEGKLNLGNGWSIEEKFRKSTTSGRFIGVVGQNPDTVAGTYSPLVLNTSIDNLDNMFNDIKASKTYDMAGGKANVTGGFFYGSQNVALTWWWNTYTNSLANPSQYGAPTTIGWNTFGGCCDRTFDVRYNTTAPYAAFNFDKGPWNIDASVRNNNMTATGSTLLGAPATATTIAAGSWTGQKDTVNYSINKNSYSLGANYAVNKDMSAYGRISDGYNFSADRLLYGAVGGLNNKSPAFNEVKQQEVGVKYRSNNFSLFGTYFQAQTDETNFDALTQVSSANSYDANGFELEAGYRSGNFRLAAGATFTNAKITKAVGGANVGKKPMRQADMVFQLTPSYRFGDAEVGLAIIGTTESFADDANTLKLPGYTVANLFANYRIDKRTTLSMGVNNLFDTLAFTEAEAQNATGGQARALPGRTARVSLRYDF